MDTTTLFLHLPKTAGTTFYSILRMQYGNGVYTTPVVFFGDSRRHYQALDPERRKKYTLIRGHFYHGLHEDVPGPSRYITFIRDPVARIVSYYYYFRANKMPGHPIAETAQRLSLTEFVDSQFTHETSNDQVRRIAGASPANAPVTEEIFQRACDHLKSFAFVGLTERFDESLMFFWDRLGWWIPPVYVRSKVVSKKSRGISDEAKGVIEAHNRYDIRLYDLAKELFESAVAEMPSLHRRVARFRRLNQMAGVVLPPAMRAHRVIRERIDPSPPLDLTPERYPS